MLWLKNSCSLFIIKFENPFSCLNIELRVVKMYFSSFIIVCSQAFMNEEKSQQAETLTEFKWLGHKFPVNNAKTRVSILKGPNF